MLDVKIGRFDMTELAESFSNLPEDKYTEGGFRFRRLSNVTVQWVQDHPQFVNAPGVILQSSDVNNFLGDIERHYEPIEQEVFYSPRFIEMLLKFQELTGWEGDIAVHQIRIVARPGMETPPAPEGPHQDGYTWTIPFVLGGTNITGGEFTIYDHDMNPCLWGKLDHNYAVFDDMDKFHYADPIKLIDEDKPGYWDVFVITAG